MQKSALQTWGCAEHEQEPALLLLLPRAPVLQLLLLLLCCSCSLVRIFQQLVISKASILSLLDLHTQRQHPAQDASTTWPGGRALTCTHQLLLMRALPSTKCMAANCAAAVATCLQQWKPIMWARRACRIKGRCRRHDYTAARTHAARHATHAVCWYACCSCALARPAVAPLTITLVCLQPRPHRDVPAVVLLHRAC
mgnify:CR=1 FL=1